MFSLKSNLKKTIFYNLYQRHQSKPLININNRQYPKRALLSYSVALLKSKLQNSHPNHIEISVLNNVLNENGYIVDVYNNTDNRAINYSQYELIIGEGLPISNYYFSKKDNNRNRKIIYYATGSHPFYQNQATYKRIFDFERKYGLFLPSSGRIINDCWGVGASLADFIILIGNEVTKSTFIPYCKNNHIYTINPPVHSMVDATIGKRKKKNKFLWFGSYGLIHKGLDTVLEVFLDHPNAELEVCGYLDNENDFISAFSERIKNSSNIHFHGFLSIDSNEFLNLMEECSFTILTSSSEGCATGILTCMAAGGLIPVITENCGIDLSYGLTVPSMSQNDLSKIIVKALEKSDTNINEMALKAKTYARKEFTEHNFTENLTNILNDII